MKIRVTGGMSSRNSIAIQSDQYRARATVRSDGSLDCKVTPLSWLARFDYAHPNWPIPRVLWISLFMVANIKRKTWLVLGPLLVLFYGGDWYLHKYYPAPASSNGYTIISEVLIGALVLLIVGVYAHDVVAPWHGAEHMTIVAYRKHGSTGLDDIAKESPVSGSCGGRFLLPMTIAWALATFVLNRYLPWLAAYAVILEVMFWLDKLWGFDRILGFAQAGTMLQKYITTRQPERVHLETAQLAIENLIAAHI